MLELLANNLLTNDLAASPETSELASDLFFWVGVAGFEPTASSSRTKSAEVHLGPRSSGGVCCVTTGSGPTRDTRRPAESSWYRHVTATSAHILPTYP